MISNGFPAGTTLKTEIFLSLKGPFLAYIASRAAEGGVSGRGAERRAECHRKRDRCGSGAEIREGKTFLDAFRRTTVGK